MPRTDSDAPPPRLLTFRGGGWALCLSGALIFGVLLWHGVKIAQTLGMRGGRAPSPALTNGFDLRSAIVPIEDVAIGFNRDGLRALDSPSALARDELEASWGKKYVVDTDRVVGVALGGEARAYPVRVLNWHEIVNDELGGVPIAVTYNGLCDSAVVFDRRLDGETLALRHSGLVFCSHPLYYYESSSEDGPSLFSQLQGRAISGPRARQELTVLRCELTTLGSWMAQYPDSPIVPGNASLYKKCYKTQPYRSYQMKKELQFPVTGLPDDERDPFSPVVIVALPEGAPRAFFHDDILRQADAERVWKTTEAGVELVFEYQPARHSHDVGSVRLLAPEDAAVMHARWFSWYAANLGRTAPR